MSINRNVARWVATSEYCASLFKQIIILIFMLSAVCLFPQKAFSATNSQVMVGIPEAELIIQPEINIVLFGGKFNEGTFPSQSWEIKSLSKDIIHFRNKSWNNFFWKIDCSNKQVWSVEGSDLGTETGKMNLVTDISMRIEGSANSSRIHLTFQEPVIVIDQNANTMKMEFANVPISDVSEWDVRRVSGDVYHFRYLKKGGLYWELYATSRNIYQIWGDKFGFFEKNESRKLVQITTDKTDGPTAASQDLVDIRMSKSTGKPPKSEWFESEKSFFATLLNKDSYDTLVVPFQVGGYAIDRPGRSLMTKYLIQRIKATTNLKLPNPTLVSRTLGETYRTFDEFAVYQLANKLGVKRIIRTYVGHNHDLKMHVAVVMQARGDNEYFSPLTSSKKIEFKDIPFNDENTPSDAFCGLLDDIMSKLNLDQDQNTAVRPVIPVTYKILPEKITDIASDGNVSPILRSYYLQLLGMLHPEQTVKKEQLFERSLAALREVSPDSPDYKVLKARALFYLHRRPAAVVLLGKASSNEQKALSAFIDGNQVELENIIKTMQDPLAKLISQIELSDLTWAYNAQQERSESHEDIGLQFPAWSRVILRRLQHQDGWNTQSNVVVKQDLDKIFPIADFTVENLIKDKMVLGELSSENEDIEFAVYNHYRRLMETNKELYVSSEDGFVDKGDVLDLLVALGESNLLKNVRLRQMQGLPDKMLETIKRYEAVYHGHPELLNLKADAIRSIETTKKGQIQKNLQEERIKESFNVCYQQQGQTTLSSSKCSNAFNFYSDDFPRRWYWKYSSDPSALSDRRYNGSKEFTPSGNLIITSHDRNELINLELSLMYNQSDFNRLTYSYNKLKGIGYRKEAAEVLQKNNHRFVGSPLRTNFLSELAEIEGDIKLAKSLCEEGIRLQPKEWQNYYRLSVLFIKDGEFVKAASIAKKYPLFSVNKNTADIENIDTVALSNYAYAIAKELRWHGAFLEAKPLLQLSADYQTGSSAGNTSEQLLALMAGDYPLATKLSLNNALRYKDIRDYNSYMELLHIQGYHDEGWSVYRKIQELSKSNIDWRPVIIGHQMTGKLADEQIQWLSKQDANTYSSEDAVRYVFLIHALDRPAGPNLIDSVNTLRKQAGSKNSGLSKKETQKSKHHLPGGVPENTLASIPSFPSFTDPWVMLAEGYSRLKAKNYSDAYTSFKELLERRIDSRMTFRFAIPYAIWSAAKSGEMERAESFLTQYKEELGDDFDYQMSNVFLFAGKQQHGKAIQHLKKARNRLSTLGGVRALPAWYQLLEVCEWLYEESGYAEYQTLLLEFAKLHQQFRPMDSWAYAFEAKHNNRKSDRLKALAIATYLDLYSEHISTLSTKEKNNALEWIEKNNPFLNSTIRENKDRSI